MSSIKSNFEASLKYIKAFLKWVLISIVIGVVCGIVGSAFHLSVDFATEYRMENPAMIILLPVGGVIIAAIYALCKRFGNIDTARVFEAVKTERDVPVVMAPLIFVSTFITHLFGGSAGREGAALQLGGSIGYNIGRIFKLSKKDLHIIVMSGMSAVFAALFGTPITAAVFSLEVVSVGVKYYAGLVPCVLSSVIASQTALLFGVKPVSFDGIAALEVSRLSLAQIVVLSVLCALVSILFCVAIRKSGYYIKKFVPNSFIRVIFGGAIIVLLTMFLKTTDYNGAGMDVITRAMGGSARPYDFILKILFTAITISVGFKGGEIVPAFFVGATFGAFAGGLLGIDAGFAAAIGFVAVFCGATNCPLASLFLAIEVFGGKSILLFAICCSVSYMMSGNFSLYGNQKIVYSKIEDMYVNEDTRK